MAIVKHEYFALDSLGEEVYITVHKPGYPILEFSEFVKQFPRVKVTKVMALKTALENSESERVLIGELKPLIQCRIYKDKMKAAIQINATQEEMEVNRDVWKSKVIVELQKSGVKEGILLDAINNLVPMKEIVVAKGIPPVDGEKANIRYYELSKKVPVIREEGNANYYDMNFIDRVEIGGWLGEKIHATDGKEGRTVTGESIPAKKGKDLPLRYDEKTVEEFEKVEGKKTVLKARKNGAIVFKKGKIAVGTHLKIDGDVGFGTGNIDFDGSVEITGTILEGFSVKATQDISVLSNMGIHVANSIESTAGNIYIKGGVFGRNKTVVRAAKNIYIKHANDCTLEAGKDINIGFYAIGSKLEAECIYAEESKGRIIGGEVKVKYEVKSAEFGNRAEMKTYVEVDGFDRESIQKQITGLLDDYKRCLKTLEEIDRKLEVYEQFKRRLSEEHQRDYHSVLKKKEDVKNEITQYEEHRNSLNRVLEIKGEGLVSAFKCAYPDVFITIRNNRKHLTSNFQGSIYFFDKGLLVESVK